MILTGYPEFAELVHRRFPTDPAGEEALTYALELYVRAIPDIDVGLDGWKMVRLVTDTADSLRAVGIMYVLPTGELPVEIELSRQRGSIRYKVRVGAGDAHWDSLSDSKRWKAVYLYAIGELDEEWTWSEPIVGCLVHP